MRLTETEALRRLASHDHGTLATVHPDRGVDAVPVVYAVTNGFVGVPIDRVKPKSSFRLQREQNLEADPRAALLIERWDRDDWSKLWWVRAELRHEVSPASDLIASLAAQLSEAFMHYQDQPFAGMLVLRIEAVSGWSASRAD